MVNLVIPKVLTQVKKADLPDGYVIEVMRLASTVLKMVHLLSQHMTDDDTQTQCVAQGQQLGEAVFDKVRGIESGSASKEAKRIWCEGVIGLAHHGDCYEPLFTSFNELLPQCEWEM